MEPTPMKKLSDREVKQRAESLAERNLPDPFGLSIADTAAMTAESVWTVKEKLRTGEYTAKKSGRRTIVVFQSVKDHWARLPDATFNPSKARPRNDHSAGKIQAEKASAIAAEKHRARARGRPRKPTASAQTDAASELA
jgi:hypothetical protein